MKAKLKNSIERYYRVLYPYMHNTCFELLLSERYVKDDPNHIKMMKNFNTKNINKDEL